MSPTSRAMSTASLLSSARRSRWSEKLSSIASRASSRARSAGSLSPTAASASSISRTTVSSTTPPAIWPAEP